MHAAPFNVIFLALELDIDISSPSSSVCMSLSKNTLLSKLPHNMGRLLLLLLRRWRSAILICCLHFYLLGSDILDMCSCFFFFVMYVQSSKYRPIHVHTVDMFATHLTTFELPSYAADLAHLFAKALFPPPSRTRLFNKLVLDFLDIEAEHGENCDGHCSPSC